MGFLSRIKGHYAQARPGFTLIEILIIAPVVIIAISGFIALMVNLVGDVLVTRDQNNLTYETQDALDRIEQDTRLSTQFLTTTGTLPSPQGSDNNFTGTAAFTNASNTLLLGGLNTDKTPADSSRKLIYYANQPNPCNSAQVGYNRVFLSKVIYFIKSGSLWRRAYLPDYNTNVTPDDFTICAVPWQRNTCSPGYNPATRCQTNDSELMQNVSSFNIKYFSTPTSTTDIGPSQALAATTIEVTINGQKTTAGRNLTSTGSMRATKFNNIDVDIPIPAIPTVTGQANATAAVFNWDNVPLASSYALSYSINGGGWTNLTVGSQTTTYTVNANLGDSVTMHVSAKNTTGSSSFGEAIVTIPYWTTCNLQNGWQNYGGFAAAAFTKTSSSVVTIKGLVYGGTAGIFSTICVLPEGYRPTTRLVFMGSTAAAPEGTAGRVDVAPTGEVQYMFGSNGWMGLDNIRFVAAGSPYTWTNVPLSNNWVNYGAGGYGDLQSTVDSIGRTHVQGLVKNGIYADWTAVGQLPVAQAPSRFQLFPAYSEPSTFNSFGITASGAITARGANGMSYYGINGRWYPASFNSWTDLNLLAGWQNYESSPYPNYPPGQYTKSSDKIVSLRGLIKNGTTSGGTVIANLPPGYRPKERLLFVVVAGGSYGRIDVLPNGNLEIRVANAGWTSLDAISFVAEQ